MQRRLSSALLALVVVPLGLPAAHAAATLDVTDSDIRNLDGKLLTELQVNRPVTLIATLNNSGPDPQSGPVSVLFKVSGGTAYNFTQTVSKNVTIAVGATTDITLDWTPSQTGSFTLETSLQGQPATTRTVTFRVSTEEVVRGSIWEFMVQYAWVYGALVAALVLYGAVLRHRKPGTP